MITFAKNGDIAVSYQPISPISPDRQGCGENNFEKSFVGLTAIIYYFCSMKQNEFKLDCIEIKTLEWNLRMI